MIAAAALQKGWVLPVAVVVAVSWKIAEVFEYSMFALKLFVVDCWRRASGVTPRLGISLKKSLYDYSTTT